MRIGLISYEFPPVTLGGIGTYARHSVRMLVERGHDVTVFAGTTAEIAHVAEEGGARVHRLPCADRQSFAKVAVPAFIAEHAHHAFAVAEVPDLYAEGAGLRSALPGLPFILRAHTPVTIAARVDFTALPWWARSLSAARRIAGGLLHRENPRKIWHSARLRASWRARHAPDADPECRVAFDADLVVPPSRRLAQELQREWRLPEARIRLLAYPHYPAPELISLPAGSGQVKIIAFHGGIRRFKGVHTLADAIPLVAHRHPEVKFVFAGSSGQSPVPDYSLQAWRRDEMVRWRDTIPWLKERLRAHADRVEWSGFVPPERLGDHLRRADVCVFPSLFDNFPSACLEAMSAARPIVATRSGGMEEMIGNEEGGLLVPPDKPHALARALCRLIEDSSLRQRLALCARERLKRICAPAVIGARHEEILREAVARRRSSL